MHLLRARKAVTLVAVTGLLSAVFATSTLALSPVGGGLFFEGFSTLRNKETNPNANVYIINQGNINGQGQGVVYDKVGDGTSVKLKTEGLNRFARLAQHPTQTAGIYYNAEVAELRTGTAADEIGRWKPELFKPVILTSRIRFSDNYKLDGSGNAVGSAGIWLWNSPIDFEELSQGIYRPQIGIGLNYATGASALATGFNFSIIRDSFPVFSTPISGINPADWNVYTVKWEKTFSGAQKVTFYLNGEVKATETIADPLGNLSLEVWNDNQYVTPEYSIAFQQAVAEQNMDVDYISIFRLP